MAKKKKLISVVIPTLNERENIPILVPRIIKSIGKKYDYEIIFVDDNSPDGTFAVIEKLAKKNHRIKGICMYKRAGVQPSFVAGIQRAKGEAIINMDADLQHPPELLPKMISLWEAGHDLVEPVKDSQDRSDWIKRLLRTAGYKTWKYLSHGLLSQNVSEFRLIDRKITDYLSNVNESEKYVRGLVRLAANNPKKIPYKVGKRQFGKTSFSYLGLLEIFLKGSISFSTKPLRFGLLVGAVLTPTILLTILLKITSLLINFNFLPGLPLSILFLTLLVSFNIFYLGIVSEYIGVVFKETKGRPTFKIGKTINL